eukprot:scaffold170776_cov22-Tisochrysis_lutea.AAC.1
MCRYPSAYAEVSALPERRKEHAQNVELKRFFLRLHAAQVHATDQANKVQVLNSSQRGGPGVEA